MYQSLRINPIPMMIHRSKIFRNQLLHDTYLKFITLENMCHLLISWPIHGHIHNINKNKPNFIDNENINIKLYFRINIRVSLIDFRGIYLTIFHLQ